MARDYARIMTSIWKNREFRALAEADQRLYLLLVTQPDISAAGVLRLSLEWWADMAADSRAEDIVKCLLRLESGRFIVLDRKASEVLIRSFIRWDAGYNNPKRRPVIIRAAEEVRSPRIAATLAAEFRRVGLPDLDVDAPSDRASDGLSDSHGPDTADEVEARDDQSVFPQVDRLTGSEPGTEPGTDRVTNRVGREEPTTHNPSSRHAARDAADTASEDDDRFAEFWTVYPRKVKKLDARKAWRAVMRRKIPATDVVKAATAHADRWRDLGKPVEYIPYPASWLRGGSWADDPDPVPEAKSSRHLAVVGGPHVADPANGVYWEQ